MKGREILFDTGGFDTDPLSTLNKIARTHGGVAPSREVLAWEVGSPCRLEMLPMRQELGV